MASFPIKEGEEIVVLRRKRSIIQKETDGETREVEVCSDVEISILRAPYDLTITGGNAGVEWDDAKRFFIIKYLCEGVSA
jgi:hypothetical protein